MILTPHQMELKRQFPEGTVIGDYLYFMHQYETSRSFDLFGILSLFSLIMGRDIVVDRPATPVHLNSYIVFCAESGVARKTTAINHVRATYDPYLSRYPSRVSIFSARGNLAGISRP